MIEKLRHQVIIQTPSVTRNSRGAEVAGWTVVATVWADVRFLSGTEQVANNQVQADAQVAVRIRHRTDVTPKERLVWDLSTGDRYFSITAAADRTGERKFLDLACQEIIGSDQVL